MEFTIAKEDLLAAIDKCSLAVSDPKHPTEAFRLMLVDATKKKTTLRFAAVGEFCSVDTVTDGDVKTSGSFHVKPKHLHDITSSMPPGKISISMKGTRITVASKISKRKASFEAHTADVAQVLDPGREAAWRTVSAPELLRGLRVAKAASTLHSRAEPSASLLIPTARGVDVFGCNMYLVCEVQTSLRMEGEPVIIPATLVALLALMAPDDENVSLFVDHQRVYLENADTLVSAQLFDYKFITAHVHLLAMLKDEANAVSATLSLAQLSQGTKSVLSCAGFAGDTEKNSEYGVSVWLWFKETAKVMLDLADADAHDEFDVVTPGAHISCCVSARLLEQMLASFSGVEQVQMMLATHDPSELLIMRCQGITYGLMVQKETAKK